MAVLPEWRVVDDPNSAAPREIDASRVPSTLPPLPPLSRRQPRNSQFHPARAAAPRPRCVTFEKAREKRPRDFAFLALSLPSRTRYIITRTWIVLATRDFAELICHRDSAEPERESWRNPLAERERERKRES